MALLTFYKRPQPKGYSTGTYLIEDNSDRSSLYFDVTDFPQSVGGGRYVVKLRGNGQNLRIGRTVDVELIDAEGNNMYVELLKYTDRFNNYYIMFEVYDNTPKGPATMYLVGEAMYDIPSYNKQVRALRSELQNQTTQLEQLQVQITPITQDLQLWISRLDRAETSVERVSESIEQLNIKLQQASPQARFFIQQTIQRAEESLRVWQDELDLSTDTVNELQRKYNTITSQARVLQADINQTQQRLENLTPQLLPALPVGDYNVRWSKSFNVLPFERNVGELVFDKAPIVDIVQTIIPERALASEVSASISGSNYSIYTSSIDDYTIVTSNFQGYDLDAASSTGILDKKLRSLLLNPTQKPATENTVDSSIRARDVNIINGYARSYTNRFGTIVKSANGTIRKDFLGGSFNFANLASTPGVIKPSPPSGLIVSGSTQQQLQTFSADIIEVLSDTEMRISKPLELVLLDTSSIKKGYKTKYTARQASQFTGSIVYLPNNPTYVTSSVVSQSFLQVTFRDFKPISGETYRIKSYYKRGIATADYKLIYDQVVFPVEYLTDGEFPNQTTYARRESDSRLIGHFTQQSIADDYWLYYVENPSNVFPGTVFPINSSSLSDSIPIPANYEESGLFATKYFQNYSIDQLYTLSFNVTLDPGVELEIYMNSNELNLNTFAPQAYPRAFLRSPNLEKTRYRDEYNRFGQFVGKIINNNSIQKRFGRVEFDFQTDGEGFGRPVFRSNIINRTNITGSAYVSEISIKPISINGFNPSIIQFNIPFNNEIENLVALSQSIDFKIDYFDYTGKQSEFTTYINEYVVNFKGELPSNTCQAQKAYFYLPVTKEQYDG